MNEQMKKNLRTAVQNFWGATSPEWIALAELLASQPAAIDKDADEFGIDECIESLIEAKTLDENFSARNQLDLAIKQKIAADSQEEKRCEYCDGTGDVHGIDGEWRGTC